MAESTHTDATGRAHMVDTGDKPVQHRIACATGRNKYAAGNAETDQQQYDEKGRCPYSS